uniref:Magnesium-translocating P-type ATPase n=1 Tax=Clostridioides difficile TaxID=1496 RepID=A0A381KMW9_CLODI|nr:magnesium-translocating P-type ATPase [Clostridioides difficile]
MKVDEIPFDFTRRRLTTVVQDNKGKTQMVTKGAVEEMLSICAFAECNGGVQPLTDDVRYRILETVDNLNDKGFRVLAIAQKSNPSPIGAFGVKDECDMVLIGYLAFLDPPKESTADAIKALKDHGVITKILTGDNDKVTRTICKQVGLEVRNMLLGSDLEQMGDAELARVAVSTDVFAKLTPDQKARVVSVLRENGHTVGFMGDGINDAAAMKAADIGISVDTAVDVAKESADIILLEKDLMVLEQGIIEGRKTYANMIKYIKMTASSNFGNMFSVLAASALLPFLPMMSVHLIFLNLIYDLSCTAIPWDNVDEEFITKPRKWDASSVGSFMIWIGPTSSIFDFTTYIFMYFVFCPLFVSNGVLFNDLPAHFSGAELVMLQAQYIGDVPSRVVRGIYVEPDISHSHDSYSKAAFCSESCISSGDFANNDWNYSSDHYSVYCVWNYAWICCIACSILCLSDSMYSAVYDFGNKFKKSLCPSFRRTALRRWNDELERTLDDPFWNYRMAWS